MVIFGLSCVARFSSFRSIHGDEFRCLTLVHALTLFRAVSGILRVVFCDRCLLSEGILAAVVPDDKAVSFIFAL